MKSHQLFFLVALLTSTSFAGNIIDDPVRDYLLADKKQAYADNTTRSDVYFEDDTVFRAELDFDNNGTKEVLVSSKRDRDGRQGNVWTMYQKVGAGYSKIGSLTFSQGRFYLGDINELGHYGMVTFGPGGGGEGTLWAYILEGTSITRSKIGDVTRDSQTGQLKGAEILDKYLGEKAAVGDSIITPIDAKALAKNYGIRIEPRTSLQALQQATPTSMSSTTSAPASALPAKQSSLRDNAEQKPRPKSDFPLILGIVVLVTVVGFTAFMFSRRRK